MLTDEDRIEYLESLLSPKRRCVLRDSTRGRGFRLHELTNKEANYLGVGKTYNTVREAIDAYWTENDV